MNGFYNWIVFAKIKDNNITSIGNYLYMRIKKSEKLIIQI
jgi:hypothetical protein